ncbi:MAG TPA: PilZ domain-containing protein [Bryobacteraceae bacterium]|nr:PilZ domain-containing protein [Bryobacteraceae bacterium]
MPRARLNPEEKFKTIALWSDKFEVDQGKDQRKETRFPANEPASITLLDFPGAAAIDCVLTDVSGRGMRVRMQTPIAPGAPVKVHVRDTLALGEVIRSERDGESFLVALHLRHSLRHLDALEKLNRSLMGERVEQEIPEATTRHNERK